MSISNILKPNGFKLFCGTIEAPVLVKSDGTTIDTADIPAILAVGGLTADTLLKGNGNNLTSSTIKDDNGDIELVANKCYKINNKMIIDEVKIGPTVESAEIKANLGNLVNTGNLTVSATLKANAITSIGANDNINIDANGTGIVHFTTIANGGVKLSSSNATNWSAIATNSEDLNGVVIGTYKTGLENRPTVGSNTTNYAQWQPLWLQGADGVDTEIICGDATKATAQASGSKLFVSGATSSTAYKIGSTTVLNSTTLGASVVNASLTSNSGNLVNLGDLTVSGSASLKTNSIVSVGANDNIVIDANGTGHVRLSTLTNGGVRCFVANSTDMAFLASNNNESHGILIGTQFDGAVHKPHIAGTTIAAGVLTGPNPLWMQRGGSAVIIGDASIGTVGSDVLYVGGSINTSAGRVALAKDRVIPYPIQTAVVINTFTYQPVASIIYPGSGLILGTMSNLIVEYSANGGFIVAIRLRDLTNSTTIVENLDFTAGGANQMLIMTGLTNIPVGPARLELQAYTSTAPNITIHGASLTL